nr:MAG TPA: hypothetical protein [Caudoviricetes sp.]
MVETRIPPALTVGSVNKACGDVEDIIEEFLVDKQTF